MLESGGERRRKGEVRAGEVEEGAARRDGSRRVRRRVGGFVLEGTGDT